MWFSEADLEEFITIWQEDFHERLTPDRARAEATRFLELCLLLAASTRPKSPASEDSLTHS